MTLLLSVIGLNAFAEKSYYDESGKLYVLTHFSPPWSYEDCSGAEIDIIKEAFIISSIKISCVHVSYARLVKEFSDKQFLFASPVTKYDTNKAKVYYSEPFIRYIDVAVSYQRKKINLGDLSSRRVVAYQNAKDYLGENYLSMVKKSNSYHEIPGREGPVKMLQFKRTDYVVGEQNILNTLSNKLYPKKKLFKNLVLKKWDIRAASYDKDLMAKFNKGLQILRKRGVIKSIYKKYNIIL